jgi:hypothetical protein
MRRATTWKELASTSPAGLGGPGHLKVPDSQPDGAFAPPAPFLWARVESTYDQGLLVARVGANAGLLTKAIGGFGVRTKILFAPAPAPGGAARTLIGCGEFRSALIGPHFNPAPRGARLPRTGAQTQRPLAPPLGTRAQLVLRIPKAAPRPPLRATAQPLHQITTPHARCRDASDSHHAACTTLFP